MKVEVAVESACELGESPRWDAATRRLYWVDVPRGALHRFDPRSGTHDECHREPCAIGACAIEEDAVLLCLARGTVKRWRDGQVTTIVSHLPGEEGTRWNDVVPDVRGRLLGGTMPTDERSGRLYLVDLDGTPHSASIRLRMPNGLAFPTDDQLLYVDSARNSLFTAFYDVETCELAAPSTWLRVPRTDGIPDGIALDEAGGVWCAMWDGAAVVRYDAAGAETHRLRLPVRNVAAVAFAGADLDELFITTAASPGEALGGAVFRATPPYRGRALYLARIV